MVPAPRSRSEPDRRETRAVRHGGVAVPETSTTSGSGCISASLSRRKVTARQPAERRFGRLGATGVGGESWPAAAGVVLFRDGYGGLSAAGGRAAPVCGHPQIPADPYDIPAAPAQQLIGYRPALHLTAAQQRIYDTAMRLTPEKGPCCCRCWRWTAFQGFARYFISDRGWQVPGLAALISDLDGCGGSDLPTGMAGTGMGASPGSSAQPADAAG